MRAFDLYSGREVDILDDPVVEDVYWSWEKYFEEEAEHAARKTPPRLARRRPSDFDFYHGSPGSRAYERRDS